MRISRAHSLPVLGIILWLPAGYSQPLPEPGDISGVVKGNAPPQALPLTSLLIQLLPWDDPYSSVQFRIVTDGESHYRLPNIKPGGYDLIVVSATHEYTSVEGLHVDGMVSCDLSLTPATDHLPDEQERLRWRSPVRAGGDRRFVVARLNQARALGFGEAFIPAFEAMRAACEWALRHSEAVTKEEHPTLLHQIIEEAGELPRFCSAWGFSIGKYPLDPLFLDMLSLRMLDRVGCAKSVSHCARLLSTLADRGLRSILWTLRATNGKESDIVSEGLDLLQDPALPCKAKARMIRMITSGAVRSSQSSKLLAVLEEIASRPVSESDRFECFQYLQYVMMQLQWAMGNPARALDVAKQIAAIQTDVAASMTAETLTLARECVEGSSRSGSSLAQVIGNIQLLGRGQGGVMSPDSRHVAFVSVINPPTVVVQQMAPDVVRPSHVFMGYPLVPGASLAWSPDGTRLAWASAVSLEHDPMREGRAVRICVAEIGTGDIHTIGEVIRIPPGPVGWLPGSRCLVFSAFVSPLERIHDGDNEWYRGRGQVCSFDVATGELHPLTGSEADDRWPVVGPQGDWIAFVRDGGIWVMRVDGSDQHRLAEGQGVHFPQWSPDGQAVAYYRDDVSGALWIVELNTRKLTKVVSGTLLPISEAAFGWTWRPDCRGLIFCSEGDLMVSQRSAYELPRCLTRKEVKPGAEHIGVQRLTPTGALRYPMIVVEANDQLFAVSLEPESTHKEEQP